MSLITELPAIFESFSDARRQGFLAVMALKERQIPPGWYLLHLHAAGGGDGRRCRGGIALLYQR